MSLTEINNKVDSLLSSWEEFKTLNDQRLSEIEQDSEPSQETKNNLSKLNNTINQQQQQIDDLELSLTRPNLYNTQDTNENFKSFGEHVTHGNSNDFDVKSADNIIKHGSFLYTYVNKSLKKKSIIRSLSQVYRAQQSSFSTISLISQSKGSWKSIDLQGISTSQLAKTTVSSHEMFAEASVPQSLLDEPAEQSSEWIIDSIIEQFSELEAQTFISGDGINSPLGLLERVTDQQLVLTKTDEITSEDIINLYYSLEENYLSDAVFLANQKTLQKLRKMTTKDGSYFWNPYVSEKIHETLLGFPIYRCSHMPDDTVIFANLRKHFLIVDFGNIKITKDPFTNKPLIEFYAIKKIATVKRDMRAIKILKKAPAKT